MHPALDFALVVAAVEAEQIPSAGQLAEELGLPLLAWEQTENRFVLTVTSSRLELRQRVKGRSQPVFVDFSPIMAVSRCQEGIKQPLARAMGLKSGIRPKILDTTPGLGRDALVLAALGSQVIMVERSPVMAMMLAHALKEAMSLTPEVAGRMTLKFGDAAQHLANTPPEQRPDVIYLDPMHPERTKTALVKQEMRLLRAIVGDDIDADKLLEAALTHTKNRVVVKRPRLGPPLAGLDPHAVITGKTVRYDLYFTY